MINKVMEKCSWMNSDVGLLVLRIGVGAIFIMTGAMKVSDLHSTVGFFASIGFGAFWAYLVTFVELLGGIAVILGVFPRIASGLLFIVMIVATFLLRHNIQMVMTPLSMLFSTLAIFLSGGGKYSVMKKKCCGECRSETPAQATTA